MRPTGMDTLLTRGVRSFTVAALGIAAAATAGCSSMAATVPAHPDSRQLLVGRSCSARQDWAAITLSDTSPTPMVTVPPGGYLVVTVPRWNWGTATDVDPAHAGILQEQCTVLLPSRGRRTIFLATRPGSTRLGATVQPGSNAMMPGWGGEVTVRASRG
jgi:hypothetical protein